MLINDLDKMEVIVSRSSDLEWDGWDVVRHTKSDNAMFFVDGVYKDGLWFKKKIFPLGKNGWNVPKNIGNRYAKMER